MRRHPHAVHAGLGLSYQEGGLNGSSASSGAGWKSDGSGTTGKGTRWVGGLHSGADGGFGGGASGQFTNGGGGGGGYSGGWTQILRKEVVDSGGSFNAGTNQKLIRLEQMKGMEKSLLLSSVRVMRHHVISQGAGPLIQNLFGGYASIMECQ